MPAPPAIPAQLAATIHSDAAPNEADASAQLPPLGAPPVGMDAREASACASGSAEACTAAARAFAPRGGYRVTLSKAEADAREQGTTRYAERGCALGSGEGCALAAQFGEDRLMDGRLERACQLGYTASCGSLGDMRFHGWKRSRAQRRQDAELVERACLANSQDWRALTDQPGAFCHMLYAWHRERELPRDRKAEARFLALACQQGYSLDCPCRDDTDCAKELFCASGRCTAMSGD